MKALHRAVVGGGFGVLAMAGVASSIAFACTPQARLGGVGNVPITGAPGATVVVEARGFAADSVTGAANAGYNSPVLTWNAVDGPVLATLGEATSTATSMNTTSNVWTVEVQIPADAAPGVKNYIVGSQTKSDGALSVTGAVEVYVIGDAPVAPVPALPGVTTFPRPVPSVTSNPAPPSTPTPQAGPAAPTAAPASARPAQANATAAVQVPTASPSPAAPASAVGVPPATASGPQSPGGPVDPTKPASVPPSEELWSGLNGSTSALALLDAPAPASSGSGFPVGAALLGTGLLALAGTAALAGRRRLAIAMAVRR